MDNNDKPEAAASALPRCAFSIREFCEAHAMRRTRYYELKRQGLGPEEMLVGSQLMVSVEAAERWRRRMEARAQEQAAELASTRSARAQRLARRSVDKRQQASRDQ